MLILLIKLLYLAHYLLLCGRICAKTAIILHIVHDNLSVHSTSSLLEVDGKLCAVNNCIDNFVVYHNSKMLVYSSTLKGYVVLLYALDVNSRVNPEYPVILSWILRKIRTVF